MASVTAGTPAASDTAVVPGGVKVRLGVSSCLLGERVRWNAGHERQAFLTDVLGPFVEWVPMCPEFELGLGVPRPTIRLERHGPGDAGIRLVEPEAGTDLTDAMRAWSKARLAGLTGLDGFVLKKASPSCGPDRIKVVGAQTAKNAAAGRSQSEGRSTTHDGVGIFAQELAAGQPSLPTIDEGRMHDAGLREAFFDRVFAHARLRSLGTSPSKAQLLAFHARHKYTLLAHDPKGAQGAGQILGGHAQANASIQASRLHERYAAAFFVSLAKPATRAKHANVLQHIQGFVRDALDAGDKAELGAAIAQYRAGLVPLIVPVTLIRHHLRKADAPEWVRQQSYLEPYPAELMLRNAV